MPFILYQRRTLGGPSQLERVRDIRLAGDGPIKKAALTRANATGEPHGWHATEDEILRWIGVPPQEHAIIIDLKPRPKNNVSLYRLRDVWGYSYHDWTPLALRIEALYVDQTVDDAVLFKRSFPEPTARGDLIGEFLYVQGGVNVGSWNWGMVGRVNGALLWPDAFAYLSGSLAKALSPAGS